MNEVSDTDAQPSGESIGPYRLIEKLGEGGMGTVYLARQESPIRRDVALKLIKRGMDTDEVVRRFEAERQVLALMEHPCIATVLDGGAAPDGRPFFVMELVRGEPITDYCLRRELSLPERLDLAIELCNAVHHAHQKGVIHRDLKPSNVLVVEQDGRPLPKVIDFGIAKATAKAMDERSLRTEVGQIVGTLEYMSPEQADFRGADIDTRSDVYSLGVLLYEILAGAPPFELERLKELAFLELQRVIRDEDPPQPSSRVANLRSVGTGTTTVLARQLKGELDWIVMKALAKDREQRYQSAFELGADLGRYLRDEPVVASPPSRTYRLRKFVRRHRLGVVVCTLFVASLIIGMTGFGVGMVRARDAEAAALEESEFSMQVMNFLLSVFESAGPEVSQGEVVSAESLLQEALRRFDHELEDQPRLQGRMRLAMGEALEALGESERAIEVLEDALVAMTSELPPNHEWIGQLWNSLGSAYDDMGMWDKARAAFERAIEIAETRESERPGYLAAPLQNLASLDALLGNLAQARANVERSLEIYGRMEGRKPWLESMAMTVLADIELKEGNHDQAETLLRDAMASRSLALGPSHPSVGDVYVKLSTLLEDLHQLEESRALLLDALELWERTLGPDHPRLTGVLIGLGNNNLLSLEERRGYSERAVEICERKVGPDHQETATAKHGLSVIYSHLGLIEEAEHLNEEVIPVFEAKLGKDHSMTAAALVNAGSYLARLGDLEGAEEFGARGVESMEAANGPGHVLLLEPLMNLATVIKERGRYDEALDFYLQALEIGEAHFGAGHFNLANVHYNLACLAAVQGDREGTLGHLEDAASCGWKNPWTAKDPDLRFLHGDEEFEALLDLMLGQERDAEAIERAGPMTDR